MSIPTSPLFALSNQGGGSTPVLQTKSVTLTSNGTVSITPDEGYNGLEKVNVTVSVRYKLVGGTIFYIDSDSTKTYKFYDSEFNEIQSVSVGDTPFFYEVLDEGNSKDKFYVYYDAVYPNKFWTYKDGNGDWVLEEISTGNEIGDGKANTATVMAKDDGAYVTTVEYTSSINRDTIWKTIDNMRNSKIGGCDDWFVPSLKESEKLQEAGAVDDSIWTSSEYFQDKSGKAYYRTRNGSAYGFNKNDSSNFGLRAIRAF